MATGMTVPTLETRGLSRAFGAVRVARDINFALAPGARHALIGPNGAGKSSFVALLTGALRPDAGQVLHRGEDITGLDEWRRARRRIARTFQINQLFRAMTVIENVALAVAERRLGPWSRWLSPTRRGEPVDRAAALLERFGLLGEAGRRVDTLAYGRQRLVEIAIALAGDPTVLILDEPAAGVPDGESHVILDALDRLGQEIAILIIEHDMDLVFRFAGRISVLANGAMLMTGAPEEVRADPDVRAVYLGEDHD
jgi:ABC-type branched-subunit amino acid transport system ATPase component